MNVNSSNLLNQSCNSTNIPASDPSLRRGKDKITNPRLLAAIQAMEEIEEEAKKDSERYKKLTPEEKEIEDLRTRDILSRMGDGLSPPLTHEERVRAFGPSKW